MGHVGDMRRGRGSAARLVAVTAVSVVLALLVQSGGAVAGSPAGSLDRSGSRELTAQRGTSVTSQFFGLHAPLLGNTFPNAPVGSVDLTTNNVYWPQLETSPGHFDFSRLRGMVSQARGNGAKPLLVLGLTPDFHSKTPGADNVLASVPDMDAWKAYVRLVATEFGSTIDYQIWPEPNVKNNFTGTPQQMAALVVAAAKIIHNAAPRATVVAPAMVLRLSSERVFMKAFFRARVDGIPVARYVDAVGVDPYPLQSGTPEDALKLVTNAQRMLTNEGVTAPVWNLEINYFVPVGGVTPAAPPTARLSMSYVIRTYVLNAAANVKRVYWLIWGRYFNLGISMVAGDGVTPTAAGTAFSRVHTWLLGQRARGCTQDRRTGVYACKFVRAGHATWIYWVQRGTARVAVPSGARRVQTMYGAVSHLRHGDRIHVTNAPVRVYH
jgi:polysaccharide biosynthesis protein PslG